MTDLNLHDKVASGQDYTPKIRTPKFLVAELE